MYENDINSDDQFVKSDAILQMEKKRKQVTIGIFMIMGSVIFMVFPPLFIVVVLIIIKWITKTKNELTSMYKDVFVRELLENNFENVVYQPTNGFTKDAVDSFDICRMGNRFFAEDYLNASFRGINFEVSDVRVADESSDEDSSSTTMLFEGRFITFDFSRELASSVKIFSDKFKYRALTRKETRQEKVELESVEFNKKFDVFSDNPHDAFYLITPNFMERLNALTTKYKSVAMSVTGRSVVVAFNEPENNAFDPKTMAGKVDYVEEQAKIQSDIDDIKIIISTIFDLPE